MSITKDQLKTIKAALSQAMQTVLPIVTSLSAGVGKGDQKDCRALSAWGDLVEAKHKINKALEV